ncbi:ABC transporter substrate-binding protein [Nonomuraea sp. SYSU D8015]|uniref:ABC transporter substrate-binding protein n=1 Tax=Nonomuraea sp. SYSU D8015 TaxID=2593644 RepID=UPI0016615C41|nr:ABC transporter substrate-binding protein [Nonomuraea sp. SYSU D8015]
MSHGAVMLDDPARVGNFIHTIDRLCRRPARGEGVQDSPHAAKQHTGRRGIPLVELSEAGDWPAILAPQGRAATHVISPGIPRAHPDIQPGEGVPEILSRIVTALRGSRLRFPRYQLTARIVEGLAEAHGKEDQARRVLREADRNWGWGVDAADRGADHVPFPVNVLLKLLPGFLHDLRLSGRVPWLSGRFRWLRRALSQDDPQAPGVAALLAGLDPADGERLSRLLLSAFMDDLSAQYRRSPLHVRGASHVFYPLLLLNEHASALVDLVEERRAELDRFDPVVVVSYTPDAVLLEDDEEPLWRLIRWRRELVTADDAAAWRQVIRTPLTISAPPVPADLARYDVADPTWVPPARVAPWWSSWTAIALFWMVLAGAVGAYAGQTAAWHRSACATGLWTPWTESGRQLAGTECVGVAEPDYLFTPGNAEIEKVQAVLQQENGRAARLHEEDGRRPYVTIVYLAALTTTDRDALAASREGLAGVAIAQKRQNASSGASEPLVRILLANAGGRMQHGSRIARLLLRYRDEEAPIVGVVGLDQSRQETVAAIQELGKAGLPMVASTLSADRLVNESPFYFQVAPQNSRQAWMAAAFADSLVKKGEVKRRAARVYYSHDVTDYYSSNLHDRVVARLKERGFAVEGHRFTPIGAAKPGPADRSDDAYAGEPRDAGVSACGFDGLVYFAGRGIPDFAEFIKGIADKCAGAPPVVLGGDDVTRYAADVRLRSAVTRVGYYYESFAAAPNRCDEPQRHDFYTDLFATFPFECEEPGPGRTLDGHAALSYDATETMITAIRRLGKESHSVPVNSYTVWRQLGTLYAPGQSGHAIEGATGALDFGSESPRQYPVDKAVLILHAKGAERPTQIGACGNITAADRKEFFPWCDSIPEIYR